MCLYFGTNIAFLAAHYASDSAGMWWAGGYASGVEETSTSSASGLRLGLELEAVLVADALSTLSPSPRCVRALVRQEEVRQAE